jgi:hypothetical protein
MAAHAPEAQCRTSRCNGCSSHCHSLGFVSRRFVCWGDDVVVCPGWPPWLQDEMIELQEREEQGAVEEKLAAEKATHDALMREANLDGVESLIDDMVGGVGGGRDSVGKGCTMSRTTAQSIVLPNPWHLSSLVGQSYTITASALCVCPIKIFFCDVSCHRSVNTGCSVHHCSGTWVPVTAYTHVPRTRAQLTIARELTG